MKALKLLVFTLFALLLLVSCDKATEPESVLIAYVTPMDGLYSKNHEIIITCSKPDAVLRYTTNGTEPNTSSLQYSAPLLIQDILPALTNQGTIKVKAFKAGYLPSQTVRRAYNVHYPTTVTAPVISSPNGTYPSGTAFTISSATPNAVIHYSLDNSEPGILSPLYHQPIVITQSGTTFMKARAFLQGSNPSNISTQMYFIPHTEPEMALVEGGSFNNGLSDISLSSFYMDKTEVTQAEYIDVMKSIPPLVAQAKGDYPVYYVSWLQAIEYCNRRSMLDGLDPCYGYANEDTANGDDVGYSTLNNIYCNWDANGYRLPTEMEWMFAAKGGNLSQGYLASGSNDLNSVAWFDVNSNYSVHPVKEKLPNELGLWDMSGNLWEWCWDIFGAYPEGAQIDPHGASIGEECVIRGGSYYNSSTWCKVAARNTAVPNSSNMASIGFRCVKRAE